MQITTMGLVLRATKINEADRMLSILTPQHGVISAVAKSALRLKNKLFSGTGLFCYSEFKLFQGKTLFSVDEAQIQEVFWGIHNDVENMALAMYLAELATLFQPVEQEADKVLKLLLNSLYFLSEHKRTPQFVKPVYELRLLSVAGYMPDLVACKDCVRYEGGSFYFDANTGCVFCEDCAAKRGITCNLSASSLAAMRHIVYSEGAKLFAFSLATKAQQQLSTAAGQYTQICVDRPIKTLEFLNTMLTVS